MEVLYMSLLVLVTFVRDSSLLLLLYKTKRGLPPGSTGWPVLGESLEFFSTGWKGPPGEVHLGADGQILPRGRVLRRCRQQVPLLEREQACAGVVAHLHGQDLPFLQPDLLQRRGHQDEENAAQFHETGGPPGLRGDHGPHGATPLRRRLGRQEGGGRVPPRQEVHLLACLPPLRQHLGSRSSGEIGGAIQPNSLGIDLHAHRSARNALQQGDQGLQPGEEGAPRHHQAAQDILVHMLLTTDDSGKSMQELDIAD